MSASREKKQRQESSEEIKITRAQEEQEQAARRKRNTVIYSIIGAVAVVLIAALLIWDTGVFQRNATVATIDGEKIDGSQVAFYYYSNNIIRNAQVYDQYGLTGYYPYTTSLSASKQIITEADNEMLGLDSAYVGKSYHEYFLDTALKALQREHVLLQAAAEAGYTLSEELQENVDAQIKSLDDTLDTYLTNYGADMTRTSYLQMIYGNSMTVSKYRTCLENNVLADAYYTEHFDELADYSDEELNAYYEENKVTYTNVDYYFRIFDGQPATTDEDGKTITPTAEDTKAAMEAAKTAAEAAQKEIEADPDSMKDSEDYSLSSGIPSEGTIYFDWLTDPARKSGDTTVIESDVGYSLVYFVDSYRDDTPTVDVRHILVSAMPEDDKATTDVDESKNAPTDADYTTAKLDAQKLLDEWKKNGASVEEFAKLAETHSADAGSKSNGGLYENVYPGRMIKDFNDWIFDESREVGDTGLVQNTESTTKGWHIIYYAGQNEFAHWQLLAREAMWIADVEATTPVERTDKLDSIIQ